jgi:hypothetical protein
MIWFFAALLSEINFIYKTLIDHLVTMIGVFSA